MEIAVIGVEIAVVAATGSLHPTILLQVWIRQCLQVGHEECEFSHLSMHRTWKPWWHVGSTLTFSPVAKSERQMTHSVSRLGIFRSAA